MTLSLTPAGDAGRNAAGALTAVLFALALGDLVFLLRALTPLAGLASAGVLVGGLVLLAIGGRRPRLDAPTAAIAAGVALLVLVLGGEGRWVSATADWLLRDAVLLDIGRGAWPVVYGLVDGPHVLRAPVGMYMAPALVQAAFGPMGAQYALLAQNTVLLAGVLALFAGTAPTGRRGWTAVLVLLVFSGLDIVGQQIIPPEPDAFPMHIERWADQLEYSSTITGLFWAPNHTLPALAFAGVYLAWGRGEVPAAAPPAVAALSLLWSPLAVIGMAPFVLRLLLVEARVRPIRPAPWLGAGLIGAAMLPCAIFLRLGAAAVPHGWGWEWPLFWRRLPLFLMLEVAPLTWLALGDARRPSPLRADMLVATAVLLVLPLYMVGLSNDLMMRAAAPSLGLLAGGAAMRLNALYDGGRRAALAAALLVLAVGAVTPAIEIERALVTPVAPIRSVSTGTAWNTSRFANFDEHGRFVPMTTYAARAEALRPWRGLFRQADGVSPLPVPPPPADRPPER